MSEPTYLVRHVGSENMAAASALLADALAEDNGEREGRARLLLADLLEDAGADEDILWCLRDEDEEGYILDRREDGSIQVCLIRHDDNTDREYITDWHTIAWHSERAKSFEDMMNSPGHEQTEDVQDGPEYTSGSIPF